MGRKTGRDDSFWLNEDSDRGRIRDAENARKNRQEITAALSHGKVSRRDLVKWGLFTTAGLMAPLGGLNPFVRPLHAQPFNFNSGSGGSGIPTGLPASPTFGVSPFSQPMPRFDVLARNAVSTLTPAPTAAANTTQQPVNPQLVGGQTGLTGPIEGRPPGANWAHQGFARFPSAVAVEVTTKPCINNTGYNPGVTSDLNSGINPAATIKPQFHPSFPVQNSNRLWLFNGNLPPKLMQVRYGEPVLFRHHNGLTTDITNNGGFGRFTLTTHEHNAHHGAENDGFTGAYFWPNQFYDYHYPWVLAGFSSINTGATDARAGAPNDSGGINKVPGDWHETMSTHWFHDHMFTFTDQNVYKGLAAMNNIYSSLDRGDESVNDGVNLRLPSGYSETLHPGWGNLDFDVNLMLSDKAWDSNGQLNMDTLQFDGFLGDQMTVNLAWKPFFNVYARRYRLRILNASVSRFFVVALSDSSNFTQIANDGNLLPLTVPGLTQTDQMGIAERFDIVIDFSRYSAGQTVDLVNLQQHKDGTGPDQILTVAEAVSGQSSDPAVGSFLRFVVTGPPPHQDLSLNTDTTPIALIPNPTLPTISRQRTFTFDHNANQDQNDPVTTYTGSGQWGIGLNNLGGSSRSAGTVLKADFGRISSQPGFATAEQWTLINGGSDWDHPIHIHFEEGQIISRNDRDGNPVTVLPAEKGRKDVYRLHAGGTVVLKMQFRDWGGMFMEHCHNTMHEDNAMLLRWDLDSGTPFLSPLPTPISKPTGVTFETPDEILPNA
jgi:FtsP/CotA-like multicopper oxidase with cupredoxin domain